MYTISEDGTLQKDGKMCFCINGESSCTSMCAAFEERAKDRAFLYCCGREIIAKPLLMRYTPSADPLGLDIKTKKRNVKK